MVTHDLPYALQLCPRALIMNGGVITADGPTAEPAGRHRPAGRQPPELPFGFDPSALQRG